MENENFSPVIQKEQKHGIKLFTFLSGLIDLAVMFAIAYVTIAFVTHFFGDWINQSAGNAIAAVFFMPFVIALAFFGIVASIMFLTTGLMTLISYFKSDKKFKRLKGLMIATIIFDILTFIVALILTLLTEKELQILFAILLAVTAVGAIFTIINLVLFKNKEKKVVDVVEEQPSNIENLH